MREVSVVVINYNGGTLILDSIQSVLDQQGVRPQVIVVDDGSTDGSPEAVEKKFPEVTVYREEQNTRCVNRLRNKGLALAKTNKVFVTDNDLEFNAHCITELMHAMEEDDRVGACIPRLMYLEEQSRIYSSGTRVHYIGATIASDRDRDVSSADLESKPTVAVGGGIALFDKRKLQHVGGFDEDYELAWGDDGELHQRLLLAGYKCLCVPSAVAFHEFKPFDESRRYRARGQLYNRWRYILTHYKTRTLVLIAPALIVYECLQAGFLLLKGLPLIYAKGTWDAIRELPAILERRKEVQSLRTVADRDLLFSGPLYVRPGHSGRFVSAAVKVMSLAFGAYWWVVRPLLARGPSTVKRQSEPEAVTN